MSSQLLWFVNRATGLVLIATMTLTVVLGVLSGRRAPAVRWPRFVTQGLHRAVAGISVVLLVGHIVSAVADDYVPIDWWQAVLPYGATYKPLYLSLGTLAFDLLGIVVATSLLRGRIPDVVWSRLHLLSYAVWALSVVHGLGIGSDTRSPVGLGVTAGSLVLLTGAIGLRLRAGRTRADRVWT